MPKKKELKMEWKTKDVQLTCTADRAQWVVKLQEPDTPGLPFSYAWFVNTERIVYNQGIM
jgi:hypothetical protein